MFNKLNVALLLSLLVSTNVYATDEIVGKWKTIDDKSGTARAIVRIYKNTDQTYGGKIEKIYPQLSQSEPYSDICFRCKGKLKDTPIIGMQILSGFIENPKIEDEYIKGQIIDPISGDIYKSKLRISKSKRQLNVRGFIGVSQLGRSQTWIRME
ncbi:DUF2147 domain-containing protein [Acinetobacter tandoii]|nr:DUF2147 domain-containing protein [Acinetobacter tandoii]